MSDSPGSASMPDVAVDRKGRIVVAWHDDRIGIIQVYAKRLEQGRWRALGDDSPTGLGISVTEGSSLHPSVAVDRQDRPIVAWQTFTPSGDWTIYVKRLEHNGWSPLGQGAASGLGMSRSNDARAPVVVIGADGAPVIVWQQHDEQRRSFQIYARRFDGQHWAEMGAGSDSNGGVSRTSGRAATPAVAVDRRGRLVAAWVDDSSGDAQIYVKRYERGQWRELGPGSASGKGISDSEGGVRAPAVVVDPKDQIIVAWAEVTPKKDGVASKDRIGVKRFDGRSWQSLGDGPSQGSAGSPKVKRAHLPSIAIDSQGRVTAVWQVHLDAVTRGILASRYDGRTWKPLDDLPNLKGIAAEARASGM